MNTNNGIQTLESDLMKNLTDEEWAAIFYGDRVEAVRAIRSSRLGLGLKDSVQLADRLLNHYRGIPIPFPDKR